jgi:hypothetical protein
MDTDDGTGEQSIESEFARTIRYLDLYVQQKMDLFLQHYLLEPVDLLLKRTMYFSVIVTVMAAGVVTLVVGMILFVATLVPMWAALLISGAIIFGIGVVCAKTLFSHKIVLRTPLLIERRDNGKP